jgi:stage II sporulation protein D
MKFYSIVFLLIFSHLVSAQESFETTIDGNTYYAPVLQRSLVTSDLLSRQGLALTPYRTPSIIRVLVFPHIGVYSSPQGRENNIFSLTIQSEGPCTVVDQNKGNPLRTNGTIFLQADQLNSSLWIKCDNGTAKIIREAGLASILYRGEFEVKTALTPQGKKFLRVLLYLPFEEYLRGVIPAEMPAEWPLESLKAQAIAARSYALYQINEQRLLKADYDVDDTVLFQAFLGLNRIHANTDAAILATQSLALTYNSKPIQAFFSADSGGYTETSENVWKLKFPYCPSKPEIYNLDLVKNDWSYESPIEKIESELRSKNLFPLNKTLKDLQVSQRSVSGRAIEMIATFTDGTSKKIWGPDAQMAIRLKSNFFTLFRTGEKIIFTGKGFGHGVGLNQWGAKALAESKNFNYRQILEFYFTP